MMQMQYVMSILTMLAIVFTPSTTQEPSNIVCMVTIGKPVIVTGTSKTQYSVRLPGGSEVYLNRQHVELTPLAGSVCE